MLRLHIVLPAFGYSYSAIVESENSGPALTVCAFCREVTSWGEKPLLEQVSRQDYIEAAITAATQNLSVSQMYEM